MKGVLIEMSESGIEMSGSRIEMNGSGTTGGKKHTIGIGMTGCMFGGGAAKESKVGTLQEKARLIVGKHTEEVSQ